MTETTTIGHLVSFGPCRNGLKALKVGLGLNLRYKHVTKEFTMRDMWKALNDDDNFSWGMRAFSFTAQYVPLKIATELAMKDEDYALSISQRRSFRKALIRLPLIDTVGIDEAHYMIHKAYMPMTYPYSDIFASYQLDGRYSEFAEDLTDGVSWECSKQWIKALDELYK